MRRIAMFLVKEIPFLKQYVGLLLKGKVLDIAMGEGCNGVFLALMDFRSWASIFHKPGCKSLKPCLSKECVD
ncbi:MAG: hypothetical protein CMH81_05210 [Nitrospiraceae bacterium]|nr:hypothetical protein [Nitrospiraceae bacterium]